MTITALRLLANHGNSNRRPMVTAMSSKLLIPRPVVIAIALRALNSMASNANRLTLTAKSRNNVMVMAKRWSEGFDRNAYRSDKTRLQEVLTDSPFEKIFRYCIMGGFIWGVFFASPMQYPKDHWPPRKPGEKIPRECKDAERHFFDYFKELGREFFTW